MRYKTDANGYITEVFFGCYGNGCKEYTGTIPNGYTDLNEWSENALINAYYIDENGNLVLDASKLAELETKIEQDTIDNVKKINPVLKITNINCYEYSKIDIITQGRNMLKVDAVDETIEGITFTKLMSGGIKISGTATADIEYNLAGSDTNLTSLFALKKNKDYYLNIGGLDCELKYYDGTTSQVYVGASGVINLSESKEVTQVLIKIPSGTTIDKNIFPMLECGSTASEYEGYKHRILTIDYNELVSEGLFPSDVLFPSDEVYPKGDTVNYIYIENSEVYISINGVQRYLVKGNVNLFDGYDTIYTLQDTYLEMTYCINELAVDDLGFLQGKSTTTNKFKILEDGSIEAHNGYFSGTIESDEGYFKGRIEANEGYFKGDIFLVDDGTEKDVRLTISKEESEINKTTYSSRAIYMYDEVASGQFKLPSIAIANRNSGSPYIAIHNWAANTSCDLRDHHLTFSAENGITTEITADGITTPVINQTSLVEKKKNINKFENGLNIVKNADLYCYNFKNEDDDRKKHIGLIIGENYKTPNEVLNDTNQAIDLYSMISVAWQSIKELNSKIEILENKIKELESDK